MLNQSVLIEKVIKIPIVLMLMCAGACEMIWSHAEPVPNSNPNLTSNSNQNSSEALQPSAEDLLPVSSHATELMPMCEGNVEFPVNVDVEWNGM